MLHIDPSPGAFTEGAMFIDGVWRKAPQRACIEVENPANEQVIASIPEGTEAEALEALEVAARVQPTWAAMPAIQRGLLVEALAKEVEQGADHFARIVTAEQGKPLVQAYGEIAAVVTFLRYAAESARRIEGDIVTSDNPEEEIHIRRHPYGVVVGLTAWNYPAALAARKLGPALVAGNVFVLLAHEATPLSGLELARLAVKAGLPKGVFNVVTGRGPVVGKAMVESSLTNLVTMTGSTRAGIEIFQSAAIGLKTLRLELGGKAPFIVMEDADIEAAVDAAVTSRYTNCGQVCTCNERMLLHAAIADQFLEKFVAASRSITLGDPTGNVGMGPKVSRAERDKVAEIVQKSLSQGAEALLPGGILDEGDFSKGHWYAPTVLSVSNDQIPVAREEVFGPVAVAMRVDSFEEAIQRANDSEFGLSAYLFTHDIRRLKRAPYELKFGELYLNRSHGEAIQGFHTGWGKSGLSGEDGKYGFDGYLRKQTSYFNWG